MNKYTFLRFIRSANVNPSDCAVCHSRPRGCQTTSNGAIRGCERESETTERNEGRDRRRPGKSQDVGIVCRKWDEGCVTFRAREGCERSELELIIPRKNGLAAKLSSLSCAFYSRWKRCSSGCKSPTFPCPPFSEGFRAIGLNVRKFVRKLLLA